MSGIIDNKALEKIAKALNARSIELVAEEKSRVDELESKLQASINGKAPSNHTHDDRYYTETEINGKIEDINETINTTKNELQASINGKAASGHTHDDRYYTETEVDNKLAGKANSSHGNHVPATQTANNATFLRNDNTWQKVTPANIGAAASSHTHDDRYYTETEVNGLIEDINETINTKEASLNSAIATAKSGAISESKSYTDTTIANLIDSAPEAMNTLNELAKAISDHQDEYEAYVNTVSTNIANAKAEAIAEAAKKDTALHTTISAEIDADVKVEKERAMEAEADLQAAIDGKAASGHNHDDRYYTESEMNTKLAGKSDTGHSHNDVYYTETEIDGMVEDINETINTKEAALQASINGKAPSSHTHDDVYYTETEVDGMVEDINETINNNVSNLQAAINGKANASHGNHVPATQTANNAKFLRNDNTWATVTPANIGAAPASHNHNDVYYTETEINTKLAGKSDTGHTHDDKYYTETEVDGMIEDINENISTNVATLNTAINGKAPASHTHDDRYYTEKEVDNKLAGKANSSHGNHVPTPQTANNATFLRNDNSWQKVTPANIGAAPASHNHNDVYYTETEVNGLIEDINETINTKEAALQASINGKANSSHNHTSVNKTMITTPIYNPSSGVLVDFNINVKSGAMVILKLYGNSYSTNPPIEAIYQFYDYASGDLQQCTGTAISGPSITLKVYKAGGKLKAWFQQPNDYCTFKLEVSYGNNSSTPNVTLSNAAEPTTNITQTVTITPDRVYSKKYKPTPADIGASASGHNHDDRYYTESEMNTKLAGKANSSHNHNDVYYTETEIDGMVEDINETINTKEAALQASINGKAPSSHTHDNRYYTETEVDNKLAGKANASHGNHVPATQTANNKVFLRNDNTWATVTPANIGAAPASHNHNDVYYTETEINTKLAGKSDTGHSHDDVYYTETEIDGMVEDINETINTKEAALQASINGKAASGHTHDDRYYTEKEVDNKLAGKANSSHGNHVPTTQTASNKVFLRNDNTWATVTPANIGAAPASHNHNDVYYTETEVNGMVEDINETISANVTTLNSTIATAKSGAISESKSYTDKAISNLVDSAPEAMNTINELAKAINDHQDEYEAYVNTVSTNIATAKSEAIAEAAKKDTALHTKISAEIDADVKVEKERAMEAENALQAAINGKANSSHGTHVTWATNAPKANGTAAVGTVARVAREDHVHPLQTSVSGNAGTATTLQNARNITIGNKTNSFNGSANISYSISDIGAAPASHTHDDRYYTETEINGKIEDINETINTKEAALQASINGKAPSSHNHTSVNKTMITTPIYNPSSGVLVDFNINVKSGAMVILKLYGNSYSTNPPIEAIYQFYDYAGGDLSNGTGSAISGPSINLKVFRVGGKLKAWFQQPNDYCTFKLEVAYGNNTSTPNVTLSNAVAPTSNITQTVTITPNRVYSNKYKPTPSDIGASASGHTHDDRYYTETEINTKLAGKANSSHNHNDIYYTETEINGKIEDINETINTKEAALQASINGKAPSSHTHDNRYYTETEVDNKLAGKANSSHGNHVPATQTANNKVFLRNDNTWQTITPANIGAAASSHTHDDRYYTETEINGKIEDINETINTKEAALQTSINGKANSSHTHNVINPQDTRAVNTSPKDVPNGLSAHLKSNGTDGLSDGGTYHTTLMIKGWNDKSGGPWGQLSVTQNNNLYFRSSVADSDTSWNAWKKVSLDGHTHDNRYYTETEVDNKLAGKANSSHGNHVPTKQTANNATFLRNDNTWQKVTPANIGAEPRDNTVATVSVASGKLTLTTAKRQKCTNLVSGTEIVFPTVTTFTEIHLYFSATTNMKLTFPECKWRIDPNIEAGKSYEIVATYNTMEWLVNVIVYS